MCRIRTILILIPFPYVAELLQFWQNTGQGISPWFILFDVLVQNAQLFTALLCAAYAWPNSSSPVLQDIIQRRLSGREAYGGVLGHLHIFAQWLCSSIMDAEYAIGRERR